MTTLVPRPPYTQEELDRLYPKSLKLQLVQVVCAPLLTYYAAPSIISSGDIVIFVMESRS